MKKTLLAAALLTGFAGAASAQNSVTLYGVVSTGLEYQSLKAGDGAETQSRFRMDTGEWFGSRVGFKGVEDLGNGLKASFVLEAGVDTTDGKSQQGGRLFGRQATVALENASWGKAQLGRAVSPGTVAFSGIDPFGASFGTSSMTSTQGQTFVRYDNMVTYGTPTIAGFSGIVGYSFQPGEASNSAAAGFETNDKDRVASVGLRYANGPILVSGIFDYVYSNGSNAGTGDIDNDTNLKSWTVGGAYDFKVAKVHAAYGQQIGGLFGAASAAENILTAGGSDASAGTFLFARGVRTDSWMVGVTAPVGSGNIRLGVQQQRPGGNAEAAGLKDQTVASIGYTYDLSKRTGLYAYYSYADNANMLDGATSNMVGVGVAHRF